MHHLFCCDLLCLLLFFIKMILFEKKEEEENKYVIMRWFTFESEIEGNRWNFDGKMKRSYGGEQGVQQQR